MEIFERMGWYGFYAVSTLNLTSSVADGGLGFSSADRGVIQGVAVTTTVGLIVYNQFAAPAARESS